MTNEEWQKIGHKVNELYDAIEDAIERGDYEVAHKLRDTYHSLVELRKSLKDSDFREVEEDSDYV